MERRGGSVGPQNRLLAAPAPKVALCSKHSSKEPTGSEGGDGCLLRHGCRLFVLQRVSSAPPSASLYSGVTEINNSQKFFFM